MKDYSQNYEDSKKFILGYDIVEGDIVIKFSNGEKYVVPNKIWHSFLKSQTRLP